MSHEQLIPPIEVPEPGFYYHYKHDPAGAVNNYAYLVLGVGHHTEEDARPVDKFMGVYRPLYDTAVVYQLGKMFDVRPLAMFIETVVVNGETIPRFSKITDPDLIKQLGELHNDMYPPLFKR